MISTHVTVGNGVGKLVGASEGNKVGLLLGVLVGFGVKASLTLQNSHVNGQLVRMSLAILNAIASFPIASP